MTDNTMPDPDSLALNGMTWLEVGHVIDYALAAAEERGDARPGPGGARRIRVPGLDRKRAPSRRERAALPFGLAPHEIEALMGYAVARAEERGDLARA